MRSLHHAPERFCNRGRARRVRVDAQGLRLQSPQQFRGVLNRGVDVCDEGVRFCSRDQCPIRAITPIRKRFAPHWKPADFCDLLHQTAAPGVNNGSRPLTPNNVDIFLGKTRILVGRVVKRPVQFDVVQVLKFGELFQQQSLQFVPSHAHFPAPNRMAWVGAHVYAVSFRERDALLAILGADVRGSDVPHQRFRQFQRFAFAEVAVDVDVH